MSAVVTPKVFVSGVEKAPAVVVPRVYISAVEKAPARLTPKVFIAAVPKNPAVITPQVFISAIDAREVATADTLRRVSNSSWEGEEVATADTSRRLLDVVTADTLRIVSLSEIATADTKIRYPRELRYVVETPARRLLAATETQSVANSFKDYDVTSFTVSLNERTLSDNFALETAQPLEIGGAVKGTLLDYNFSFLVEKTSQQGLIQSVRGMYDVDKQLYTHLYESGESADDLAAMKASEYVRRVAGYLGLTAAVKIQDFTPKDAVRDTNVTYADLISTLFCWSAKVPQRQINVFTRGGTLHVIQRGLEDSAVDISGWRHSQPTIERELVRTMWNNANSDGADDDEDGDNSAPFSGIISYSDWHSTNYIEYRNGLLVREYSRTQNSKVKATNETTYEYLAKKKVYYLASKKTQAMTIEDDSVEEILAGVPNRENSTKIVTTNTVNYVYSSNENSDGLYVRKEYEKRTRTEYSWKDTSWKLDGTEADDRQTFHAPAGNGFYVTTVYVNGVPQGSTISQGAPSNEVSQYTVSQMQRYVRVRVEEAGEKDLTPIDDTSFPIEEKEIREELTAALKWLNRKTQETVSVDIIDKISNGVPTINHVVDFTERVILDGKEYFLVSNQIQFTPRKLIQRLQLVRWY